ncbi:MAG: hypothetical protein KY464_17960 [Gemmatimonadetes bacterium]|nr:hypothetical protein [Gemmatimonadota bacterium]
MAAAAPLTSPRRSVLAALLFLLSAALAGVTPRAAGVEYRAFGMVEGLFTLLLVYLFLLRGVWARPAIALAWLPVVYGGLATAQLLRLLLPPPGVLQWVVVTGLAFSIFAAFAARSPTRLLAGLGTAAILLALLNFSVIPFLWVRAGPGPGEAWGLGNLAEGFRRLFVEYAPLGPGGELLGVVAVACWAVATRLLYAEPVDVVDPTREPTVESPD